MIRIRVSDNGVAAGLQASKRTVQIEANRELKKLVNSVVLPTSRRIAPRQSGALASKMRAGAAGNRGYIENKSPYAGIIEYGGTRRDVIRPRNGRALSFGGRAAAYVATPRTYQAQHKMQEAIEESGDEVLAGQLDVVARAVANATGGTLS